MKMCYVTVLQQALHTICIRLHAEVGNVALSLLLCQVLGQVAKLVRARIPNAIELSLQLMRLVVFVHLQRDLALCYK